MYNELNLGPSLLLEKTIYAKSRKIGYSSEKTLEILNLEVETHLRKYPEVQFKGMGKARENADRSVTYFIIFEKKPNEVQG